ncbi:MAG: cobalamin-binding protein [Acidiferrobacteraceae bacterium]|nr:cobalamin-binding protein [Acidiferrobacteraceae bacterium]MBT3769639.1 cobalamin-binding protein [Acidiferrobacteraceae bacterium]MBT3973996.1 cobalamin-binding protein [Acidiferrobacteraceae bacterium]MBT4405151.1 cobalamin-binding protein [Acidiferrobacteraceae bacterium]MBT4806026.1 cobalamin-binding protein [Acidiferrobacteraceae bacterium]
MKDHLSICALLSVLLSGWFIQADAQRVQALDDTHAQIRLSTPAQRIISLAPNLTEILFFIGAGDRVVGTVDHSDYPPAALQVPRVGSHSRFDFETILRLQPDLILAWESGNPAALVTRLEQLGLTVYRAEPATLALIASTLVRIGKLTGNDKTANRLAGQFLEEAESIRKTFYRKKLIRVFYQVWHDPLITLNGDHLVSRLLEDCGAHNVFADLPDIAPTVSRESIISRNPAAIIAGDGTGGSHRALDHWANWDQVDAVANGRLYIVNSDHLHRHSPRILEGMRELCQVIDRARRPG